MKAEWNQLQVASRKLYQANPLIKKVFIDNDLQVVKRYFDKWIFKNVILSNTDYEACINDFTACNDVADMYFLDAMYDAISSTTGNDTSSAMNLARKQYMFNLGSCKKTFDNCIGIPSY